MYSSMSTFSYPIINYACGATVLTDTSTLIEITRRKLMTRRMYVILETFSNAILMNSLQFLFFNFGLVALEGSTFHHNF